MGTSLLIMTADQIPPTSYPGLEYKRTDDEYYILPYNLGDYWIAHYTLDVDATIEELRLSIYLDIAITFAKFNKSNEKKEVLRVFNETGLLIHRGKS